MESKYPIFRNFPFVNREKAIKELMNYFINEPNQLFILYGPKSSGKTTLLEYLIETKLKKNKNIIVNYSNFRRYNINNYRDFLQIYFKVPENGGKRLANLTKIFIGTVGVVLGLPNLYDFPIDEKTFQLLEKKRIDPFQVMLHSIKKARDKGKKVIMIIDEIQTLKEIYMNGDLRKRALLNEFFNFLVSITKETHLAHVVVASSDTLFIDQIHNNAKLAKCSLFYRLDYLDKSSVAEWLKYEGFEDKEIKFVWHNLGGSFGDLWQIVNTKKNGEDIKAKIKEMISQEKEKLTSFLRMNGLDEKEILKLVKKLLKVKRYVKYNDDELKTIYKLIQHEFLFFDPLKGRVEFQSRVQERGAEEVVKEAR